MPAEGTMGSPARREPRGARAATALVFAGGDPPRPSDLPPSLEPDLVVAADSGLEHALALGVAVDLVVGDLDSVDRTVLDGAVARGTHVEQHPAAKDATDLELALEAALARGATSVLVLGAHGGRLDHFLANVLLLASPRFAAAQIEARFDGARVSIVRERIGLAAHPGALCSLLPAGGAATGVRTEGLRYPLRGETLEPGTTRGVSNEFLGSTAAVSLDSGVLVAVVPDPRKDA
jgi:thiamine pyrophosphokinase